MAMKTKGNSVMIFGLVGILGIFCSCAATSSGGGSL
jgi:hypothetical protein